MIDFTRPALMIFADEIANLDPQETWVKLVIEAPAIKPEDGDTGSVRIHAYRRTNGSTQIQLQEYIRWEDRSDEPDWYPISSVDDHYPYREIVVGEEEDLREVLPLVVAWAEKEQGYVDRARGEATL